MSHAWALVAILVAFGIAGRIEYEVEIDHSTQTTCERQK